MLKTDRVTKIYRSKDGVPVQALCRVSLEFGETGLVFLLGRSGCGKTTLLNVLGGLETPTGGSVLWEGRDLRDFSEAEGDAYRNSCVSLIFQEFNLLEGYTVGENLAIAAELQGRKLSQEEADAALCRVGLGLPGGGSVRERRVSELSGGQKQRVAVARSLIKDTRVILADEPTGALDRKTGRQLYELLKEIGKERLVIVVTHDRASALRYGDRVIEMEDGVIVSDSFPAETAEEACRDERRTKRLSSARGLPVARTLSMAWEGIRSRKARSVVSAILSAVALGLFVFMMSALSIDATKVELNAMAEGGQRTVKMRSVAVESSRDAVAWSRTDFTERQTEILESHGLTPYAYYTSGDFDRYGILGTDYDSDRLTDELGGWSTVYAGVLSEDIFESFVEVDPETAEGDLGLTPDARLSDAVSCRMPKDVSEIAITDFAADAFMAYGTYGEDGTLREISSVDEIIGLEVCGRTVTGIYSTDIDLDLYRSDSAYASEDRKSELKQIPSSVANLTFVCGGFSDTLEDCERYNRYYYCFIRLSGDAGENKAIVDDLTYRIGRKAYSSVRISSIYHSRVTGNSYFYDDEFFLFAAIITAACSLVSILLTLSLLSSSMEGRRHEMGVLRSMGAGKGCVAGICLGEGAILAAAEIAAACVAGALACLGLNLYAGIPVYCLTVSGILLTVLLGLGETALAVLWPVMKQMRKTPADILGDR